MTTEIFDGEFNATKQYSQVEDVFTSGNFDALIIAPNDSVGIATAVEEATKAGLKVATTLFPIGPKLDTLEPQVPGLTATVASNPAIGAKIQAEAAAKACEGKDPCNVVIIIGQKIYPFDNLRYETFLATLGAYPNIKVVATVEGNYDPDQSMAGMQDVLQANPDIDVILSNADQHLVGAEIALEDAGIDVPSLYISGGGAAAIAIDAIREGRWDVTLAYFPVSMGEYALQAVVDSHRRQGGQPGGRFRQDRPGAGADRQGRARRQPRLQGRVAGLRRETWTRDAASCRGSIASRSSTSG